MSPTLAFIPSPLIPSCRFFAPLMAALGEHAVASVSTSLGGGPDAHAERAVAGLHRRMWPGRAYILVAYSGAGPLVPAVLRGMRWQPRGLLFLDATLPHPGLARIDELREALPPVAFASFEKCIRAGGSWPNWTDRDLVPLIPDDSVRARLLSFVTPQPASFFEEPLPADDLPPDLPIAYLRLSSAYEGALATASARGWPTCSLGLTHFAPHTHPAEVARELVSLIQELELKD